MPTTLPQCFSLDPKLLEYLVSETEQAIAQGLARFVAGFTPR